MTKDEALAIVAGIVMQDGFKAKFETVHALADAIIAAEKAGYKAAVEDEKATR